jgi:ParB/RepB/Spo0J family partition protein
MNQSRIDQLLAGNADSFGTATPPRNAHKRPDNVLQIPVEKFRPDPENARTVFDPDELAALADDMQRHGQMQNVVAWLDMSTGEYQLIAGERRWRAAQLATIPTLVCLVVPRELSAEIKSEMSVAENMCRANLKPTEVAKHWKMLMQRWGCSARGLATRVGVAPSTVSKTLSLLKLDGETQQRVDAGKQHKTHALQSQRTPRGERTGVGRGRGPRGVHTFAAGTVKLKRGQTLADLVAEIHATTAGDTATQAAA